MAESEKKFLRADEGIFCNITVRNAHELSGESLQNLFGFAVKPTYVGFDLYLHYVIETPSDMEIAEQMVEILHSEGYTE